MDRDVMIRVEGLGKKYVLGKSQQTGRYTALRDVLAEAVKAPLKRFRSGFPGGAKNGDDAFWALRDVNLEVRSGEVVGIIGRNGAGKSTLLKILSRITEPTKGRVIIRGRVASLLEVGTGFHPELTGRENISLNGAILGMSRAEIKAKFDEIVAFAEVERFLDTPVKRYSSGMYVRLAFAVAAHLEPEILIVDEVLAVGDAQFQQKCLGKMQDIAKGGSRTVLFVSHNMGAVVQLCTRCFLLGSGSVIASGAPKEVTAAYAGNAGTIDPAMLAKACGGTLKGILQIIELRIGDANGGAVTLISPADEIHVYLEATTSRPIPDFLTTMSVFAGGVRLLSMQDVDEGVSLKAGRYRAHFVIPPFFLRPGVYALAAGGHSMTTDGFLWGTDLMTFTVLEEWSDANRRDHDGIVNVRGKSERVVLSNAHEG